MNILKLLFGKKAEAHDDGNHEQVTEIETDPIPQADAIEHASSPPAHKQDKSLPEQRTTTIAATIPWRTFPIFISSTFADMQAERDHLKQLVFPLVEEELQKRRIKLEIVDLRWALTPPPWNRKMNEKPVC